MKILILHGYGQNDDSIKKTFNELEHFFKKKYNAVFYYVKAIHNVINFKWENGLGWILSKEESLDSFFNSEDYIGINDSLTIIDEYINKYGPFDGIIGFSQGGLMTSIILGLKKYTFKFAIISGVYFITDNKYKNYDNIETHTLHIWGNNDTIVPGAMSEKVYQSWPKDYTEKYIHEGRHIIPINSLAKKTYETFINKYKT